MPSSRVPWLVILFLIVCLVLVYLGFLRPQEKLLGPPLPENTYQQYVQRKKPPVHVTPTPAPTAVPLAAPTQGTATTTPAAPAAGAATTPAAPAPATTPSAPEPD